MKCITFHNRRRSVAQIALILPMLIPGLTGCNMGSLNLSGPIAGPVTTGITISGSLHGGQQPIYNAKVQLYAAATPAPPISGSPMGGVGQGATALLSSPVTTDAQGFFSITGLYSCPSATTQVYIVASGGDPTGSASLSINNQYITLMTALGPCGNLSSSTNIQINEVTTVGAVWALQQYLAAPGAAASASTGQGGAGYVGPGVNIGASSGPVGGYGTSAVQTQVVGLTNAFKMVNNLVDYSLGTATPRNSWATPDNAKIYALANIIASCVNTNPASSTTCSSLMTAAAAGGYTPQDTVQVAYQMAHYPTNNVVNLTQFATAQPPFGGAAPAPTDFTVEVGLAPKSSTTASAIAQANIGAIDQWGHIWLGNINTGNSAGNASAGTFMSEIDADGKFLAGPFNSYTATGGYQVSSGTYSPDPCQPGLVHTLTAAGATGIAIDQNGVVYAPNNDSLSGTYCDATNNNSVMRIASSGSDGTGAAVLSGYYYFNSPGAVVVDAANNVWIPASASRLGTYVNSTSSFNYTGGAVAAGSRGVTTDMNGQVWIVSSSGCPTSPSSSVLYQVPSSSAATRGVLQTSYSTNGRSDCVDLVTTDSVLTSTEPGYVSSLASDANGGLWGTNPISNQAVYYSVPSAGWSTMNGAVIPSAAIGLSTAGLGGMNQPYTVAVDGANRAWIANKATPIVAELAVSLDSNKNVTGITSVPQPVTIGANTTNGYTMPASTKPYPNYPQYIMIDPSGNVWLLSSHTSGLANYITVMVGAATPVVTPLTFQAKYNRVGQMPQ